MIWKGYLNPYDCQECEACSGTGYNEATKKISDMWYNFDNEYEQKWCYNLSQEDVDALVEADRLWDFTRRPINDKQKEVVEKKLEDGGNSWLPYDNGYEPTAEEVNEWARNGMGHDAINKSICVEARAKREGVWGYCELCEGSGRVFATDEIEKKHKQWEPFDPPKGEGYQLWENTTEGSPSSPVFETLDELCEWAAENATTFGRHCNKGRMAGNAR